MTELFYINLKERPRVEKHEDPSNSSVKPAFKTTEFWLQLIAIVVGLLLSSGALDGQDPSLSKALVSVAAILGALGYTGLRTSAKNRAAEGAAAVAVAREMAKVPTEPSEQK